MIWKVGFHNLSAFFPRPTPHLQSVGCPGFLEFYWSLLTLPDLNLKNKCIFWSKKKLSLNTHHLVLYIKCGVIFPISVLTISGADEVGGSIFPLEVERNPYCEPGSTMLCVCISLSYNPGRERLFGYMFPSGETGAAKVPKPGRGKAGIEARPQNSGIKLLSPVLSWQILKRNLSLWNALHSSC